MDDEKIKRDEWEWSISALEGVQITKWPREGAQGWPFHLNRHPKEHIVVRLQERSSDRPCGGVEPFDTGSDALPLPLPH